MKRILCGLALSVLIGGLAGATIMYPAQKYATQTTIYFTVYDSNSPWRVYETAPAVADVHVFQNGASEARAENAVTDLGRTMSLVLSATEMTGNIITVDVNDASAPPLFGDLVIYIPTFGHASATYPVDWSDSVPPVDVSSMQNGTVTAAAIATGAVDADALATDAVDEILDNTTANNKVKKSVAYYLERAAGGGDPVPVEPGATAQAGGTANTIVLEAASSATTNAYVPMTVELVTGTGAPATRTIVSYNGTTKAAAVDRDWPGSAPNATTTYKLTAAPSSAFADDGLAQAGDATHITLAADAPATSSITGFIVLRSGTGAPDTQEIVAYNGTTKVVTVTGWSGLAPAADTYYALIPTGNLVSDSVPPTPTGLTISDVQSALTTQGFTSTLSTNLATVDTIAELITGLKLGDPNSAADTFVGDILAIEALVDSLEARLTATRAAYLDTINDLADGQRLDLLIDAIKSDIDAYDTDAEHAAAIWNAAFGSYGGAGTYGQAVEDITGSYDVDALMAELIKIENKIRY